MKSKELKRREAEIRSIRWDFVHAARSLEWYKRDVRAGLVCFHKDDMRTLVKRIRTSINTLRHECTEAELTALFENWDIPKRYRGFVPSLT